MRGPEHHAEAKRLARAWSDREVARAQLHAVIAQTEVIALLALVLDNRDRPDPNLNEWAEAIGYVIDAEIVEDDS